MKEKETKARLKQLKKEQKTKKKEMKQEMQELKGEEKGNKVASILLFLGLILAFLFLFGIMIKTDVGGIGTSLTPLLKDVTGLNKVLPSDTTADESQNTKKDSSSKKKKTNSKDNKVSPTPSAAATPTPSPSTTPTVSPNPSGTSASEQELKDYADRYSKMDPKQAAAVLGTMTGDLHLVAKILETMKAADSAEIMNNMDTNIAAKLTVIMNNDLEAKTSKQN